jgi:hypothetical protein
MQKLSLKNMSLLGLVLMGASALTAAISPSKVQNNNNGRLAANSATGGSIYPSCVTASAAFVCTKTAGSTVATTAGDLTNSYVGALLTDQTVNNTSDTLAIPDNGSQDQTSVVQ